MNYLIKGFEKARPFVMSLVIVAFIFIAMNAIKDAQSPLMKWVIGIIATIVVFVTIYYEYLKVRYTYLQKSLVTANSISETQQLRDNFVKLDKFKGMKDSITLFDVLFSLDNNQPEMTLQILEDNEKFFKSNLDMILVKRFSTFKAMTLLNNKTKSKKAYQELLKLKETNLNKSKKMNLLYNWDQINAMNLGYNSNDANKAIKIFKQLDTSKMNPRELLHLNVEIREMARRIKDNALYQQADNVIKSISVDSPFRGEQYEE